MQTHPRAANQAESGPQIGSMQFARVARTLGEAANRGGLVVPAFRSPPRQPGVRRSLQRRHDGSITVSVALRDRPWLAVQADMVDGVLVANKFTDAQKAEWRDRLFDVLATVDGFGRGGVDPNYQESAGVLPSPSGVSHAA